MNAFSGDQYVLELGEQRAVITEVGATLRAYEHAGVPVCWGFSEREMARGSQGQILAPWPNRVRDGRYRFGAVEGRAALDEPEVSNAIHGVVRWVPWQCVEATATSVRLAYRLHPQPAYPYRLLLEVDYQLSGTGLRVTLRATAEGEHPTPFGAGFHPYLSAGGDHIDGARLALPATRRLLLDERSLPTGVEDVEGTAFDAVASSLPVGEHPLVGALVIDDCFCDLVVGRDGRWAAELLFDGAEAPLVVWADGVFKYIMCYTGDTLAPPYRRISVAIEPMTCPPDALRSGDDLIVLGSGETFEGSWGITPAGLPGV